MKKGKAAPLTLMGHVPGITQLGAMACPHGPACIPFLPPPPLSWAASRPTNALHSPASLCGPNRSHNTPPRPSRLTHSPQRMRAAKPAAVARWGPRLSVFLQPSAARTSLKIGGGRGRAPLLLQPHWHPPPFSTPLSPLHERRAVGAPPFAARRHHGESSPPPLLSPSHHVCHGGGAAMACSASRPNALPLSPSSWLLLVAGRHGGAASPVWLQRPWPGCHCTPSSPPCAPGAPAPEHGTAMADRHPSHGRS